MAFSSTPPQCTYHVFLSFRGEDTRKAFTDHLYTALLGSGFRTFRDNDVIGRGENVKSELDNAIRESRSSIIVFSKDYASSRWCLDELVMILEHKRTSGHVILPVFYDVDPSQVRKQMGSFVEAFGRHEERFMGETNERKKEYLRKKVEGWRAALREVADLAGMVLQNQADGHEIKDAIGCKRVLVVLDDVHQRDQFDAIIGMRNWFYPGSKIILTTRHKQLLKANEVYMMHKVERFDDDESLELFSWHAFGQDHPIDCYVEHSKRVVQHCGGRPLALQVLGSSLSGKSLNIWENAIKKLVAIPDSQILKKLKISYESLQDDHDQNLFLHISCFFIGKGKDFTIGILDECGFYPTVGIQNLIDRCLLTINEQNKLMMHQLLRDMGREIVRQESPKELGKRSRLWHNNDSFNVLRDKTGTDSIEGLFLDMHVLGEDNCSMTSFAVNNAKRPRFEELSNKSLLADQGNSQNRHCFGFFSWHPINIGVRNSNQVELETDAFARMRKLRLLQLNYVETTRGLIALGLRNISLEQVWKGTKLPEALSLRVPWAKSLWTTAGHARIWGVTLSVLQDLNLSENPISSLPESIKGLNVLQSLRLSGCTRLQSLPELPMSLEMLNIDGCSSLGMVTNLPNLLRSLILDSSDCKKLVEVQGMFKLEPIGNADAEMIYNLGLVDLESMGSLEVELLNNMTSTRKKGPLQGLYLYECGIYSICVPGNEVPGWCSNKRKGSSISFNVPLVPNLKIIALNVYIVYAFANYISLASSYQFDYIKISNKTKGLKWTYSPMFSGTPDDNTMIWFSRWEIGRLLMEVGVRIVYDECEEKGIQHRNAHPSHHNVMNVGDLSKYHVRTGSYFLCHHGYDCHQDYHQDGSSSKTDKILFGDSDETTDGLQMKNEEKKIERKDNSKRVTCCWQWLGQEH
ncbi:unnamed protein product [Camellia sinensis]